SGPGQKLPASLITSIDALSDSLNYTFLENTPLPNNASHIIVHSLNATGESLVSTSIVIIDAIVPTLLAQQISFNNLESHPQKISGTFVITKASDESNLDSYSLYFGSSASSLTSSQFIQIIQKTGSNISIEILDDTAIPNGASYLHLVSTNQFGVSQSSIATEINFNLDQPSVNDIADQSIFLEDTSYLNVENINAPEGRTINYLWSFSNKPQDSIISISDSTTVSASFIADVIGQYNILLQVSIDGNANFLTQKELTINVIENPKEPTAPIKISSSDTNCALFNDHEVKCWGLNNFGQIGNGNSTNLEVATSIENIKALDVAVGETHICLVLEDNTVSCLGNIAFREGDNPYAVSFGTPTTVPALTDVVNISAGLRFSCTINKSGEVHCFGLNESRKIGNPSQNQSAAVTKVAGLENIIKIDSAHNHSCAIDKNLDAYCFGNGDNYQLGNHIPRSTHIPQKVRSNGMKITDMALSTHSSCFLMDNQEVYCVGHNGSGHLGTGNRLSTQELKKVIELSQVKQITSHQNHTCALKDDDSVWCFGNNQYGQLGNGTYNHSVVPVQVKNLPPIRF
ncbi:hypothetical protein MJH12_02555, partial [bacterium]|nr:hypothetical protein [bacterium]